MSTVTVHLMLRTQSIVTSVIQSSKAKDVRARFPPGGHFVQPVYKGERRVQPTLQECSLTLSHEIKGHLSSRRMSGERAFLKLPPLGKCQKVNSYNKEEDIYKLFIKLSRLHCKLQDPLKELLYQCASEEEGECFHSFSFENLLTGKGLHRELYFSPEPDHVPLWKRNISNRLAEKYRQFRFNLKDTPMSAVTVRWTKRNILASYDYHSVIQELSRFGAIESVTPSGRQTAVVIFKDIISACKAMNAFPANNPGRRIQCVWHHKFMSEYRMSGHRKIKLTS
ncbi:uncharacterized protein C6orf201 homolog [Mauremys mutica]|uniref:uncharacterized protein C6orf201 homolog n=1 Tax=Mauremys mutica TaxID=74926 RepID=UPI001D16AC16|nr:uncharacterized protein C6orf201 homolog [Mauremys mutica]